MAISQNLIGSIDITRDSHHIIENHPVHKQYGVPRLAIWM